MFFIASFCSNAEQVEDEHDKTLPDLVIKDIFYDGIHLKAKYCNVGGKSSDEKFLIAVSSMKTFFAGNPNYPYDVPKPGECKVMGGLTIGLVGAKKNEPEKIAYIIDWQEKVKESNEENNVRVELIHFNERTPDEYLPSESLEYFSLPHKGSTSKDKTVESMKPKLPAGSRRTTSGEKFSVSVPVVHKQYGQCSIDSKPSQETRLVLTTMFWLGIMIMVIFLILFLFKLFPFSKRVRTCHAAEFIKAKKIVIPLRADDFVITPAMPEFNGIINNFTDEKSPSDESTYSTRIDIRVGRKRYPLEVSAVGWNFLGEEKNCRRLLNGIELMTLIQSAKEKLRNRK